MKARSLILLTAFVLVMGMLFTASSAGRTGKTRTHDPQVIRTKGALTFEANALIQATFRFSPERLYPHTGDKVRLVDADRAGRAAHAHDCAQGTAPHVGTRGVRVCRLQRRARSALRPGTRRSCG